MVLVKNLNFFSSFYRRLNRPGKCFCCYSRKEKSIFRLSNHKVKKVEILVFFQRCWGWAIGQKFEIFSMFIFLARSTSKMCLTLF